MAKWLWLFAAICSEVAATMALRASVDHKAWIALVIAGYAGAFVFIGVTLRAGVPVATTYGIWGATGVALTAILGMILFGETLSTLTWVGIAVVIVGVVLVQTGTPSPQVDAPASVDDGAGVTP